MTEKKGIRTIKRNEGKNKVVPEDLQKNVGQVPIIPSVLICYGSLLFLLLEGHRNLLSNKQ